MTDTTELADALAREIQSIIQQEAVAADVHVDPWNGTSGPFVEVRPRVDSPAPPMSVHVLDKKSVAITIGSDTTGEATGPPERIVETVRSLARAMFNGNLSERVTRNASGGVSKSELLLTAPAGTTVLWTRSSVVAPSFRRKTHEARTFDAYPPA